MDDNKKINNNEVDTETTVDTNKTAENDVAKIECEPIQFEEDASATFITGNMIREKIDDLFRTMFVDYFGCSLQINDGRNVPEIVNRTIQSGGIFVNLTFRENSAKGFHALKHRSEMKSKGLLSALEHTIGKDASQAYVIDDDAGDALASLIPKPFNSKKVNWEMRKIEQVSNQYGNGFMPYGFNGGSTIEVILVGFPLETILKVIYGGKDDKDTYDYGCTIICDTGTRDKLFQITKLKSATVNKLYRLLDRDANYRNMGYYGNPMVNGCW